VNADHIIGRQTFLAPFVLLAGGENRARYANAARASRQKRGLVDRPEKRPWSSCRAYLYGDTRPVRVRSQVALGDQASSRPEVSARWKPAHSSRTRMSGARAEEDQ